MAEGSKTRLRAEGRGARWGLSILSPEFPGIPKYTVPGIQERVIITSSSRIGGGSPADASYNYGVIRMDIKANNSYVLETKMGWKDGQRVPILAHEMGHIYSRIDDVFSPYTGRPKMLNVDLNENPIRRELGYAERVQYAQRQIRYDQIDGPGVYDISTDHFRFLGGVPVITHGK